MKKLFAFLLGVIITQNFSAQELKSVSYKDGSQNLNGISTINKSKNLPGVLILPAWKGIDSEAKTAAKNLAERGYAVFIADIYGEGNIPKTDEEAAKIAGLYKKDFTSYQKRIALALQQLINSGANSQKIAVIGYCFGGTGALETMRAGFLVKGVVSIHGGLAKDPERPNGTISTKVLIENPAEDKSVTTENFGALIKELKDGKADWQVITYANSGHTFTKPESPEYNPVMAKRAWQHTLMFLEEVLK